MRNGTTCTYTITQYMHKYLVSKTKKTSFFENNKSLKIPKHQMVTEGYIQRKTIFSVIINCKVPTYLFPSPLSFNRREVNLVVREKRWEYLFSLFIESYIVVFGPWNLWIICLNYVEKEQAQKVSFLIECKNSFLYLPFYTSFI